MFVFPVFRKNQMGASLMGSLIAIAMLGLVVVIVATMTKNTNATVKANNDIIEWSQLVNYIASSIDCDRTFSQAAVNPTDPVACAGGTGGTALRIVRSTNNGSLNYLTGPLGSNAAGSLDDWAVRTYCDAAGKTLVIHVAKPSNSSGFKSDLFGRPWNWSHPRSQLFGGVSFPLCYDTGGFPITRAHYFRAPAADLAPKNIPGVSACFLTTIQGTASGNSSCRLWAPGEAGNPLPAEWTLAGWTGGASQIACGATCLP